jgi:hypothetical protein
MLRPDGKPCLARFVGQRVLTNKLKKPHPPRVRNHHRAVDRSLGQLVQREIIQYYVAAATNGCSYSVPTRTTSPTRGAP